MPDAPHSPFELEPEEPRPARATPPVGPPAPPPAPPAAPAAPEAAEGDRAEGEIDTRTFAEKHGQAVERVAGPRPPPPDWPREALSFPIRGAGGGLLAAATVALLALDLPLWTGGLRFASWLLKIPALLFFVRWQLDLAGMTAAGRDEPNGFLRALALDADGVAALRTLVAWLALTLGPAALLWLLGPAMIGLLDDAHTGWRVTLGLLGSLWLAVVGLSLALSDARLRRPWVTLSWIARRPLALLVGASGWWALGLAEVALGALSATGDWATLPLAIGVRGASVYLAMLAARALGVVGRAV
jgi:hypothetical protein